MLHVLSSRLQTICRSSTNYTGGATPSEARAAVRPKPRRPRSVTALGAPPALARLSHNPPSRSRGHRAPQNNSSLHTDADPVTGSSAELIGGIKQEAAGTGQIGGFGETRDGGRNPEKTEVGQAGERSCPSGAAPGRGAEAGARPPPRP